MNIYEALKMIHRGKVVTRRSNGKKLIQSPNQYVVDLNHNVTLVGYTEDINATDWVVGDEIPDADVIPMVSEDLAEYLRVNAPNQQDLLEAAEEVVKNGDCLTCVECIGNGNPNECRMEKLKAAVEKAKRML